MNRLAVVLFVATATTAGAEGYGFRTPSGTIHCDGSIGGDGISCPIVQRSGPPAAPDPDSCSGVWGRHVSLGGTGAARVARGPAPRKSSQTDVAP